MSKFCGVRKQVSGGLLHLPAQTFDVRNENVPLIEGSQPVVLKLLDRTRNRFAARAYERSDMLAFDGKPITDFSLLSVSKATLAEN
jgi:hypothetical protein